VISRFFPLFLKEDRSGPFRKGLGGRVGTILRLGRNPKAAKRFSEGQRVAFFPANGTWGEYVVVRYNSLLPLPNALLEVAHEYEFGDFQKAIQHVSSPGKTGIVLLKSPV
jgi:hypothetical protein